MKNKRPASKRYALHSAVMASLSVAMMLLSACDISPPDVRFQPYVEPEPDKEEPKCVAPNCSSEVKETP